MSNGKSIRHYLKSVLIAMLIGLVLMFVVQNVTSVEVQFLIWNVTLPRAVLYLVIFALGAIVGWTAHYFRSRQH